MSGTTQPTTEAEYLERIRALDEAIADPTARVRFPDGAGVDNRTVPELIQARNALRGTMAELFGTQARARYPIQTLRVRLIR